MKPWLDRGYRLLYIVLYRLAGVYWLLTRAEARGVFVAVWCEGRILMLKNSYKPQYSLPGGLMNRGEEPLQTAVREAREEVGMELDPASLHLARELIRNGWHREHCRLFEVRVAAAPEPCLDEREVIWAGWKTPEEALALPLNHFLRAYLRDCQQQAGSASGGRLSH